MRRLLACLATDSASSEITGYMFNGLVKYDKDALNIVGDLASKFYFENNVTLIFELKKNVKWHDGKQFNAADVIFTYETIMNPGVDASNLRNYYENIKEVVKIDERTIKFVFNELYIKINL